eukprot:TRINITY_DN2063_c0_g1_i1.p2 TRINITY_DN2063_c0_g1~~TRINITY_DN2063_c0_g1_i1.p2  ORF type:complete len:353 (-),score=83.05 TRINITY_DN2063_c0_g1_i1:50-982(-)
MGGTWAPRPSPGPHKLRECLPLIVLLRNRLKYALTGKEVNAILQQASFFCAGSKMVRGPRKHMKRLNAPSHWMLNKMGGTWAPRPSPGPHKLRECLPLIVLLRNRLKYALTGKEVNAILQQRLIKVDGKVRTDKTYPAGFMDVISIERTNEFFRLLYDVKGRFVAHRITQDEAKFKLCRIRGSHMGAKEVPFVTTHDARSIRYPDPQIKINDSVKIDIETGKIVEHFKFEVGNIVTITGGHNLGRIGLITSIERHNGEHTIVHVKDSHENAFATRIENVFVIGKGTKPVITLPRQRGIRLSIIEERDAKN